MPFLIFMLFPIAEIIVFIQVADEIGFGTAFLLAILSAIVGVTIVRRQGFENLMKLQKTIDQGSFPADELFNAVCFLVAGIALIIPGFLSDVLGFLLLAPGFRKYIKANLRSSVLGRKSQSQPYASGGRVYDPGAIDAEYEHVDEPPEPEAPQSKITDNR